MKFQSKYGYFTDDGREYVITNFRTPRPWINVISNGHYGLIISQLNGGFSWIDHSNFNRLTRWNQDLIFDNQGKFIYLRDDDSGEFWSPTFQPTQTEPDKYECRHGIGYTRFISKTNGIETQLRVFVPFDHNLEIWSLQLKNTGQQPRNISIFTYFEWCLGAAPDVHREFHKTFIETEFDKSQQAILARKRLWEIPTPRGHWNANWNSVAYFAANEPLDGFDTDKESFVGMYQNLQHPRSLENGQLDATAGKWHDSICATHKRCSLPANSQCSVHFFLGAEKDPETCLDRINNFRNDEKIETAFQQVQQRWDQLLTATTVETPDTALNFMTNTWLKYQSISCRIWGRAAYYQQSGAYGFRDQLQDSQIFLYSEPQLTRKQILLHAAHQFKAGNVLHWWHPILEQGLDAGMSDDLLWLPFVTVQYLKETADWSILDEQIVFYDDPQPASLLAHCTKAIDRALSRVSERGLPLILTGDWNDGLSAVGLEGKGESIWLGHFVFHILSEFKYILEQQSMPELAKQYSQRAEQLKKAINDVGWDGDWFWRASKDSGDLIGSHTNKYGRIFLNAQTWAIIADSTDDTRKNQALDAVEQHLEGKNGALLLQPAYSKPDEFIGYLSRYAPGVRENGGVYTHAATWAIQAACLLKRPKTAYRMYRNLCPVNGTMNPDAYCAEPYVTPGNIDGPDSPNHGRAGWTWYTGSAAWLFRITVDYLFGIRADFNGLRVIPCLPDEWDEIKVIRLFRGCRYHISIKRTGVCKISVNGKTITRDLIPPQDDKKDVQVVVEIA